mmetsp:Transcript_50226/g.114043  ORF Transcript_50226/g.114043 Transcript_50226/m.114043 type:complete len:213 (+) Transcript_50226:150-788(+)
MDVVQHASGLAIWHIVFRGRASNTPEMPNSRTRAVQSEYNRHVVASCCVPCQKNPHSELPRHLDSHTFCSIASSCVSNLTSNKNCILQTNCPVTNSNGGGMKRLPLPGGITSFTSGDAGAPSQASGRHSQGCSQWSAGSGVEGSSTARGCTTSSSPSAPAPTVILGAGHDPVVSCAILLLPLEADFTKSLSRHALTSPRSSKYPLSASIKSS